MRRLWRYTMDGCDWQISRGAVCARVADRPRVDPSPCSCDGLRWEACVCAQLQPSHDMSATATRNSRESSGTLGLGFQRLPTAAPIAAPATMPDTYRQGHCVCRSANCHADADSDCYPDRYLRSFHSALSWTSLRRYPRREQDNLGGSSPALLHRV